MQRIYDPIEEKKSLAIRLIENGYFGDAIRIVDDVLKVAPSDPETVYLKSLLLSRTDNKEEALIWAERSVKLNPENSNSLLIKAKLLHKFSFYAESLQILKEVYRINSKDTEAMDLMADIFMKMGRFKDAYKIAMRSISISPSSWNAHLTLSRYFEHEKMEKQSLKELEMAIRFNPGSNVLRMEKIRKLLKAKKREEAGKEINRKGFLDIRGTFMEILVKIEFLRENNFLEHAEDLCRNALIEWPEEDLLYFSMGEISYDSSRKEESVSYFRKAFSLDHNEWYLNRLTVVLYELGQYQAITELYNDGKMIPPDSIHPVLESFITTGNLPGMISIIKSNIAQIDDGDISFIIDKCIEKDLVYFIFDAGLLFRETHIFPYYVKYLVSRVMKGKDRDSIIISANEKSEFLFMVLRKLMGGDFDSVESEMYIFSPENGDGEKWISILFYFARMNQYGTVTTESELHVLTLKYGTEYVSSAISLLRSITRVRE